jgi:hypothetical protein
MHHGIRITDAAVVAAVELSHKYVPDRFLPDKVGSGSRTRWLAGRAGAGEGEGVEQVAGKQPP